MPIASGISRSDLNTSIMNGEEDSLLPKKKTKESAVNFERSSDRYKSIYSK